MNGLDCFMMIPLVHQLVGLFHSIVVDDENRHSRVLVVGLVVIAIVIVSVIVRGVVIVIVSAIVNANGGGHHHDRDRAHDPPCDYSTDDRSRTECDDPNRRRHGGRLVQRLASPDIEESCDPPPCSNNNDYSNHRSCNHEQRGPPSRS